MRKANTYKQPIRIAEPTSTLAVKKKGGTAKVPSISDYTDEDKKTIKEYETIPSYNAIQRILSKDARNEYNKKQSLLPKYIEAKDRQIADFVSKNENTDIATTAYKGQVAGVSVNSNLKNAYSDVLKKAEENGISGEDLVQYYDRRGGEIKSKIEENVGENHALLGLVGSALIQPLNSPIHVIGEGINYLKGNPIGSNADLNNFGSTVNNIRGASKKAISDKIENPILDNVANLGYDVGSSLADMGVAYGISSLTGGGPALMKALMSLNASSSSLAGEKNKDTNATQKMLTAGGTGAIEWATEGLPIDNLFKLASGALGKQTLKSLAWNALKQAGAEATEEAVSEVSGTLLDLVVNKHQSDFVQDWMNQVESGKSPEEAVKGALLNVGKQTLVSALAGGVSGGIMGGITGGVGNFRANNVTEENAPIEETAPIEEQPNNIPVLEQPKVEQAQPIPQMEQASKQPQIASQAEHNQALNTNAESTDNMVDRNGIERNYVDYNDKESIRGAFVNAREKAIGEGKEYVVPKVVTDLANTLYPISKHDKMTLLSEVLKDEYRDKGIDFSIRGNNIVATFNTSGIRHSVSQHRRKQQVPVLFSLDGIFDNATYSHSSQNDVHSKPSDNNRLAGWDYFYTPISFENDNNEYGVEIAVRRYDNGKYDVHDVATKKTPSKAGDLTENQRGDSISVDDVPINTIPQLTEENNPVSEETIPTVADQMVTPEDTDPDGMAIEASNSLIPTEIKGAEDRVRTLRQFVGDDLTDQYTRALNSDDYDKAITLQNKILAQSMNNFSVMRALADTYDQRVKNMKFEQTAPEGEGKYTSRTYSNTFRNSEIFKASEATMKYVTDEEYKKLYQTDKITERRSKEKASENLEKNKYFEEQRIRDGVDLSGVQLDEAMMLLEEKVNDASETNDFSKVTEWGQIIAEKAGNAARFLQAMAKYSRTAVGSIMKTQALMRNRGEALSKSKKGQNARLATALSKLGDDGTNVKPRPVPSHETIVEQVRNTLERESSSVYAKFTDKDIDFLAHMVEKGESTDAIAQMLNTRLATGNFGVSDEDMQAVVDYFNLAKEFPMDSKQHIQYENEAYKILARYMGEATFMEKWNAWRYLSMLGAPKTHVKNFGGNTGFGAITNFKDNIGAILESMFVDQDQRTKALMNPFSQSDNDLLTLAKDDADNVWGTLTRGGHKFAMDSEILRQREIFKSKFFNNYSNAVSNGLEGADNLALVAKYKRALAGFLKARGVTAEQFQEMQRDGSELLDEARTYAIQQAKIATFHEENKFANLLNQFKKVANGEQDGGVAGKVLGGVLDSLFPFTKTPLNVLKQGAIKYNPAVSLIEALYKNVNSENYSPSEIIDAYARTLTGTGIVALGAYLASKGILRTTGDKDDKELDRVTGKQKYSINVNGKSYTIDWLAPTALPLFMGASFYEVADGKDINVVDALTSISQPMIENSMLDGLDNAFDAIANSYGDEKNNIALISSSLATGYLSQGVPTILGQVARSVDDTRRNVATGQRGILDQVGRQINTNKNKIPFLSKTSQPYVNAWGETQENTGGNFLGRLAYNMLSPGYYSDTTEDATEQELYRLTRDGENHNIVPKSAPTSRDGEKLPVEKQTEYATVRGQQQKKMLDEIIQTKGYKNLADDDKVALIKEVENLANAIATDKVFQDDMTQGDTYKKRYSIYTDKGADGLATFYKLHEQTKDGSRDDKFNAVDNMDLSDEDKGYYFKKLNTLDKGGKYLESFGDNYIYDWYKVKMLAGSESSKALKTMISLGNYSEEEKQLLYNAVDVKDNKYTPQESAGNLEGFAQMMGLTSGTTQQTQSQADLEGFAKMMGIDYNPQPQQESQVDIDGFKKLMGLQ